MAHEGRFDADGTDKGYNYEVVDWIGRNEDEKHGTGEDLTESDLPTAAEVIVKIEDEESGDVYYETITGEFENWQFIDDILEFDFGSEGSRP